MEKFGFRVLLRHFVYPMETSTPFVPVHELARLSIETIRRHTGWHKTKPRKILVKHRYPTPDVRAPSESCYLRAGGLSTLSFLMVRPRSSLRPNHLKGNQNFDSVDDVDA